MITKFAPMALLCAAVTIFLTNCSSIKVPDPQDVVLQFQYDNSVTAYYCGSVPNTITTANAEKVVLDTLGNVDFSKQTSTKAAIRVNVSAKVDGGWVGYTTYKDLIISKDGDGKFHMNIPKTGEFQVSVDVYTECRTCSAGYLTNTPQPVSAHESWNNSNESNSYKNDGAPIVIKLRRMTNQGSAIKCK